ncbi:MAG: WYL domain-containing protein [Roseiflexaceae bacterium]|nr:WYL domain-containing protein [Roseiflexaceae bacterium]
MTESEKRRGGDRRSSMLTFQRRMLVARRLIRGEATTADLVRSARDAQGPEAYPPDAAAAVRHDIAALRDMFLCEISYHRAHGYRLDDPGDLALLDLPDVELEALGFLLSTFADGALPNATRIDALLDRIIGLLPESRRVQMQTASTHPRLEQPRSARTPEQTVIERLKRALGKSQIEFEYISSYASAGEVIQHTVAPHDLVYRDGHTYLTGYCLKCRIRELVDTSITYRVDRIVVGSLRGLPQQLPAGAATPRRYQLRYWLSSRVAARRDIALWFPNSHPEFLDDGSALVQAQISDLWQARQVLLRYREHCRVIEPPELIAMMQESIEQMRQIYQ